MTQYSPNTIVTIDGVAFTSTTVDNVEITSGRSRIWEQARASVATINLLSLTDSAPNVDIEDPVIITVKDSTNANVKLFTGTVTEVSSQVVNRGQVGEVCITTVTAYGPFAKMARTVVGTSSYPKEYDDIRMDRIFDEAGVTIDTVDTPGIYELAATTASLSDAYTRAAQYAQMVGGYIYETVDGKVGFANESRRLNDVQANSYMLLPENIILAGGVSAQRTRANIVNDLVLVYKNSQTVTATDATSISTYGLSAATFTTQLENLSEAQLLANRYINLLSLPETSLGSIDIELCNPNMTDAVRDDLLAMRLGFPVAITGLPKPISTNGYDGFVEGWKWSINRFRARLSLITTEATLSIIPTRWQDVDPLTLWNDVPAAVQWFEYE